MPSRWIAIFFLFYANCVDNMTKVDRRMTTVVRTHEIVEN
ncbi:hypothetical protein A3768_5631 (plasmid) [Ralstonia solanacearum]|nr:hypothetical protein A3768_5631 [Ralstonia solanacearum]